jgi:hypothetical protein
VSSPPWSPWAPLKLCPVASPLRRGFCCIGRLAPGTYWLPRVLWNMANLMPDDPLVKCTQCDAWPMALAENDGVGRFTRLTFRCPRCRAQEVYQVGVGDCSFLHRPAIASPTIAF